MDPSKYLTAAEEMLASLCSPAYLAQGTECSAILLHSNGNINTARQVDVGESYADYYFIKSMLLYKDIKGSIEDVDNPSDLSIAYNFKLYQNYPNPFNRSTLINYILPTSSCISLRVYDIFGREVKILTDEFKPSGEYSVEFNAKELPSGIYIYKFQTGNFIKIKRMSLVK